MHCSFVNDSLPWLVKQEDPAQRSGRMLEAPARPKHSGLKNHSQQQRLYVDLSHPLPQKAGAHQE